MSWFWEILSLELTWLNWFHESKIINEMTVWIDSCELSKTKFCQKRNGKYYSPATINRVYWNQSNGFFLLESQSENVKTWIYQNGKKTEKSWTWSTLNEKKMENCLPNLFQLAVEANYQQLICYVNLPAHTQPTNQKAIYALLISTYTHSHNYFFWNNCFWNEVANRASWLERSRVICKSPPTKCKNSTISTNFFL